MNVKLNIPTSLNDITIEQFQGITNLIEGDLKGYELDNEILKLVLGFDDVDRISVKDRKRLADDITKALKKEGVFNQRFKLNGVEYGLIPNFDNITNGEYTDLIKYCDDVENLHRFITVAYRPIIKSDSFKNYLIESYEGTGKHSENIKQLPMSIANGVKVFFWSLSNDLKNYILTSTEAEQVKEVTV